MIPFEYVIWNARECAEYLGQRYSSFIKRGQYVGGFPPRCPMPGHPRWRAADVVAFTGQTLTNP